MLSALYAIACPSVCPSLSVCNTGVSYENGYEVRIMKFSPYGSSINLVLRVKFHPEIIRRSPRAARTTSEGLRKQPFSSVCNTGVS